MTDLLVGVSGGLGFLLDARIGARFSVIAAAASLAAQRVLPDRFELREPGFCTAAEVRSEVAAAVEADDEAFAATFADSGGRPTGRLVGTGDVFAIDDDFVEDTGFLEGLPRGRPVGT